MRSRASTGCKIRQLCILWWFFKKATKMYTNVMSFTDYKNFDVPFVELRNRCLHEHYVGEGVPITHDLESNDDCTSQF